jgi:hypothetical protein
MVSGCDENLNFVNTLGREFCASLEGVVPNDYLSSQDCYSVISPFLATSVTPEALRDLSSTDLFRLTAAFNAYFECSNIELSHVQQAITRTLWHWQPALTTRLPN